MDILRSDMLRNDAAILFRFWVLAIQAVVPFFVGL